MNQKINNNNMGIFYPTIKQELQAKSMLVNKNDFNMHLLGAKACSQAMYKEYIEDYKSEVNKVDLFYLAQVLKQWHRKALEIEAQKQYLADLKASIEEEKLYGKYY